MVVWSIVVAVLALALGYAAWWDRRGTPSRISRRASGDAERAQAEGLQNVISRPNNYPPSGVG